MGALRIHGTTSCYPVLLGVGTLNYFDVSTPRRLNRQDDFLDQFFDVFILILPKGVT
jgi:hypothetical protein